MPIMVFCATGRGARTGGASALPATGAGGSGAGAAGDSAGAAVRAGAARPGFWPGSPIIVRLVSDGVPAFAGTAAFEPAGAGEAGEAIKSAPHAPQNESFGLQGVPQLGQREGTVMEATG
ncbi:MAG: hypothetical protein JWN04_3623 [Myxococcaceae bacterium]|nr:hypothetical protein [Myxococcaceae bacterium]